MRTSILGRGVVVSFTSGAFAAAIAFSCAPGVYAQAVQTPAKPAAPASQAPAGVTQQAPREAQVRAAQLPSVRSIVDRYIDAIGGRKAILAHSSSHATGTMTMAGAGISGGFEVYNAKPNKSLMKVSLGGIGEILEGFDGTHGWGVNPVTGPTLAEGIELQQKSFDADFYSDLHDESRYSSMKTVEKTTFEGRPCYKVSLVKKIGGEDFEFYDVETGLKAGAIGSRETQMGSITATMTQSDYKRFGGMLVPTTIKQTVGGVQQVITLSSIEFDNVPPSTFEVPERIKALIK